MRATRIDYPVLKDFFDGCFSLDEMAVYFRCSHAVVCRAIHRMGWVRERLPNRLSRENHPNWRGGRIVDQSGYVRIKVGHGHPEADCKGYAKEHRLVMSKTLGRPLDIDEIVHHINRNRQDNRLENLVVMRPSEHSLRHGQEMSSEEKQQKAARALKNFEAYHKRGSAIIRKLVPCQCGCGILIETPNRWGAERRFVKGHTRLRGNHRASASA